MQRVKSLLVAVVVCALAASGVRGNVIGNFEGGLDGWIPNDATLSTSSTGATLGTSAMKIETPTGWKLSGRLDLKPYREQMGVSLDTLFMDVTASPGDVQSDWMNVSLIINAMNTNDTGPQNNLGWNPLGDRGVPLDGNAHTYQWFVSPELQSRIAATTSDIWWFELMINSNMATTAPTATFYVDNIRLIPEPATVGLLGLGALCLVAVRRKRAN